MDIEKKINKLAQDEGFDFAKKVGSWSGRDVYVADTEEECCVGLPQYILVSGEDVRWASVKETEEIMASDII